MVIVLNKCVGCGECVPFCPKDALRTYGKLIINKDKCTNCNHCINYCPIDAIVKE